MSVERLWSLLQRRDQTHLSRKPLPPQLRTYLTQVNKHTAVFLTPESISSTLWLGPSVLTANRATVAMVTHSSV